ncbi:uncharacterized protein LOC122672525 [Telopea speciosissima]|uniref:uncharacterized protein LOC122672525 n=1 Tax=Telopea speciosissima TaxID=54955 RepID=UPI001CC3964A|nr:uncharacterized protein LOC122672525 [Telopea speciosissima]
MEASISDPNNPNCGDAYGAAFQGEVDILMKFYKREPTSSSNIWGDTIFHVLALKSHTKAIMELLNLSMPINGLKEKNSNGNTALHEAVRVGALEIAKKMVQKEESLVHDINHIGETPLYWAAAFGQTKMFQFLARKTRSDNIYDTRGLRRNDGSTILHAAVIGEFYGLALEIMGYYPDLAFARDKDGITALHLLVHSPSSFRSGTDYSDINLLYTSFIPLALFKLMIYFCIPWNAYKSTQMDDLEDPCELQKNREPGFPFFGKIYKEKQKHNLALDLAKLLIKTESMSMKGGYYIGNRGEPFHASNIGPSATTNTISDTLMLATRHGTVEVVEEILKECPWAIEFVDENKKNIFHLAAEFCKIRVLVFLKSKGFITAKMIANVDNKENTALHLAAKYVDHRQNKIHISAYKMAVETIWFKKVKEVYSQVNLPQFTNCDGKTANELFDETHKHLKHESVKWIKSAANTNMVISTLIATMNFTAAFAVPGGYHQNTGLPIFANTIALPIFYAYSAAALFFCVGTLAASLSAYFSRFNTNDFYIFFPLKYILAGTTHFLSAIYSVTAFVQALILVTNGEFTTLQWCLALSATIFAMISFIVLYMDIMFPVFRYFVFVFFD